MSKEDDLLSKLADSFGEDSDPSGGPSEQPDKNGAVAPEPPRSPADATRTQAERAVLKTVPVTMGISLVPVPVLDLAVITGLQVYMTRRIAAVYDQPFSTARVKSIVTSLLTTALSLPAAGWLGYGVSRLVPGLGHLVGSAIMPTVVGSTTYGIGMFFIDHFQSGKGVGEIDIGEASKRVAEHAAAHRSHGAGSSNDRRGA